jgi:hypothetical protein
VQGLPGLHPKGIETMTTDQPVSAACPNCRATQDSAARFCAGSGAEAVRTCRDACHPSDGFAQQARKRADCDASRGGVGVGGRRGARSQRPWHPPEPHKEHASTFGIASPC